jgi:hypothetical protein
MSRICQGDILRDTKFHLVDPSEKVLQILYPYVVVLSQDCDLEQYNPDKAQESGPIPDNQFMPYVLLAPCFLDEVVRSGNHLVAAFNIKQDRLNSERWNYVKQNRDQRYHYLKGQPDMQVPDLVLDFKHYLTSPFDAFRKVYKDSYLASVSELFREDLSLRFCSYLSRVGLPVLP